VVSAPDLRSEDASRPRLRKDWIGLVIRLDTVLLVFFALVAPDSASRQIMERIGITPLFPDDGPKPRSGGTGSSGDAEPGPTRACVMLLMS
jgi:hypothetical protein